jgi:hypothetical protein
MLMAKSIGKGSNWRRYLCVITTVLMCFVAAELMSGGQAAFAQTGEGSHYALQLADFWVLERFAYDQDKPILWRSKLDTKLLAKADPDECFAGIGKPYSKMVDGKCPTGSQPKNSQAYVWGMTHTGKDIWFGTMANTLCYAMDSFNLYSTPMQNKYWVCEFDEAASGTGDWRAPRIYRYEPETKQLQEKTLTGAALALLNETVGLRSAGSFKGVVFLGGPSRDGLYVNLFAFDGKTGGFLGSKQFSEYTNIREWLVASDSSIPGGVGKSLYVGMGKIYTAPLPDGVGGVMLKWTGSKKDPFKFDVVGNLPTEAANLTRHQGRLCVSTWPSRNVNPQYAADIRPFGVFCSPLIPAGGLTPADASHWTKIWGYEQYDPEPVLAMVTGGGAIRSFNGNLFWGTMNLPFLGTLAALKTYPLAALDTDGNELDVAEILATVLGTHRSVSLFRARNVGVADKQTVDLVYGETFLPKFDAAAKSFTIANDDAHRNRMGKVPLQGASGMGNFFNTYIWSSLIYNKALYLGTFDWTQLARVGLQGLPDMLESTAPSEVDLTKLLQTDMEGLAAVLPQLLPKANLLLSHPIWLTLLNQLPAEGADLLRIEDTATCRAAAESRHGLGNNVNYGVRTLRTDGKTLFVGMANAMSLSPRGGWELIGLQPK